MAGDLRPCLGTLLSRAHIETLLKRAVASRISAARLANMIFYFRASHTYERVHPLQSGVVRRKLRRQRRPGLPRENALVFYARRLKEFVETYGGGLWFLWTLTLLRWRIQRDPASRQYTDIAITPAEGDDDGLEMYQATEAGHASPWRGPAAARLPSRPWPIDSGLGWGKPGGRREQPCFLGPAIDDADTGPSHRGAPGEG
jgi:hypothetical protein